MKTYARILSAFLGLAALALGTRAQEIDQIAVNIPHDFVVGGKTLPAGNYRVNRLSQGDLAELVITSVENRAGALFRSTEVRATREDKPSLRFQHIGDQYFLSQIETQEHTFTIPVSPKAAALVANNQTTPTTDSNSGAN